jgi:hypothetical protein
MLLQQRQQKRAREVNEPQESNWVKSTEELAIDKMRYFERSADIEMLRIV